MRVSSLLLCLTVLAMLMPAQQQSEQEKKWLDDLRASRINLRLADWKPESNIAGAKTSVPRAKFPAIDVHNHLSFEGDEKAIADRVKEMDAANVRTALNLTGTRGQGLQQNLKHLSEKYPGRFVICTQVDYSGIDDAGFSRRAAQKLEEDQRLGARCVKFLKNLGLGVKDKSGRYVPVNDPRLDAVWAKAGELKMPIFIHTADPIAFFRPLDERNEAYVQLLNRPDWWFYGEDHAGAKRFTHEELMKQRNDIVERHPKTTFVALHYASLSHDLAAVGALLDRYPNMMVEMGARNWALGKVPNSGRKFATKYQDRILFGTDATISARMYETWFRTLETDDDLIVAGVSPWGAIHGLKLPDEILRKIYNGNAKKLFPFLK